jgi:integrase
MTTFKTVIYTHHQKQDGSYNIKIRVTHNRRNKYISTIYFVYKDDLTRSLKLKNQFYINETNNLIHKYRKICDSFGERLKTMTIEQIVDALHENNLGFRLDFIEYGKQIAEKLKSEGRIGTADNYITALNNLMKYTNRKSINISEISVKLITDWIEWIKKQTKGERACSLYPGIIRAIYNRARLEFNDEDANVIRIPTYPFKRVKLPAIPVTRKRALDAEHIRRIVALDYDKTTRSKTNRYNLAKDVFILSFGLVGMNAVDLYNCTELHDGRLYYNRSKTKSRRHDKAEMSVKIEPEITHLLEKYKDTEGKRVFCFYKLYATVNNFSSALNKGLKKIGDQLNITDLEFYAARHSWASIARNDLNIDKYTIHAALNHVVEEMKVTDIYLKKDWSHVDNANRKVLDCIKNRKLE